MTLGLSTKLHTSFGEAVERTTQALADQGFGVLTKIDNRSGTVVTCHLSASSPSRLSSAASRQPCGSRQQVTW